MASVLLRENARMMRPLRSMTGQGFPIVVDVEPISERTTRSVLPRASNAAEATNSVYIYTVESI